MFGSPGERQNTLPFRKPGANMNKNKRQRKDEQNVEVSMGSLSHNNSTRKRNTRNTSAHCLSIMVNTAATPNFYDPTFTGGMNTVHRLHPRVLRWFGHVHRMGE